MELTDDQRAESVGELFSSSQPALQTPIVDAGANLLEQLPAMVQGGK
ncbi:hypothetical protein [Streptomyces sp. URMC 128]